MIFTEGQCDYTRYVSSAMKLLGCDEKQGEDIKPEPFCESLPFAIRTCLWENLSVM